MRTLSLMELHQVSYTIKLRSLQSKTPGIKSRQLLLWNTANRRLACLISRLTPPHLTRRRKARKQTRQTLLGRWTKGSFNPKILQIKVLENLEEAQKLKTARLLRINYYRCCLLMLIFRPPKLRESASIKATLLKIWLKNSAISIYLTKKWNRN